MSVAVLVDFGSTFTKLTAVDLTQGQLLGKSMAYTTIEQDIMVGYDEAMRELHSQLGRITPAVQLASSSAAGGLRLAAVGLVPDLTLHAAQVCALGAGANIVSAFSYELTEQDLQELNRIAPEIIILCGGTDGGNKEILLHNAEVLARLERQIPIIFAGNHSVAVTCARLLENGGQEVILTENVMPQFGDLRVEPVREAIRQVFMRRIVKAKGLDRAEQMVGRVLMPTPSAVLRAVQLVSADEYFLNDSRDMLAVDIGGATTDVYSINHGRVLPGAIVKGAPEPRVKRTVEGDLGMRFNAPNILKAAERGLSSYGWEEGDSGLRAEGLRQTPGRLPETDDDRRFDLALARAAIDVAVSRHAGQWQTVQMPFNEIVVQTGVNLCEADLVVGTGGFLAASPDPLAALRYAAFREEQPFCLKPHQPRFLLDKQYLLYAVGLLAEEHSDAATLLARSNLQELS